MKKETKKKKFRSLSEIQTNLKNFMKKLQKENPNANWRNLITGTLVAVMLGTFSFWYFNSNKPSFDEEPEPTPAVTDVSSYGDVKGLFNDSSDNIVVVQKGEGLWHVAKRICNDGYKAPSIAKQNGLRSNQALEVGQELRVDCDDQ